VNLRGGDEFVRLWPFACLFFASLAYGQAAPTDANPGAESADATASKLQVAPDDPVITVNDFCPSGTMPDGSCKTIVTRAQFEKLSAALQRGMSLPLRLKVANSYAQMMRMAEVAEQRGLDQTPAFAEEMRYARMQLLSQDLTRVLQEEANRISDAELEDYYKSNEAAFEEATVARIFIPHTKQPARVSEKHQTMAGDAQATAPTAYAKATTEPPDAAQQEADGDAMMKLAAELRTRAISGEDPDKLQTEAYAAAGIPGVTPNTKMVKIRRASLPPQHESVMDLKAGEVSQVFSDPGGAHFIYKMISKQVLTLEDARPEIRIQISTLRFRDSMKPFQGNAVFSDAYFNPPGTSTTPSHPNPKDRRKKPAAEPEPDHI
jgi:hypothetical protein